MRLKIKIKSFSGELTYPSPCGEWRVEELVTRETLAATFFPELLGIKTVLRVFESSASFCSVSKCSSVVVW